MSSRAQNNAAGWGCALVIALGIAVLVAEAPYLLGDWLGRSMTGHRDSALGVFLGWLLEGLIWSSAAGLVITAVREMRRKERKDASERERLQAEARAQEARRRVEEHVALLRATRRDVQHAMRSLQELYSQFAGHLQGMRIQTSRLLLQIREADLIEPRVAHRNGPKVPTRIGQGSAEVTLGWIRFNGSAKNVEWSFKNLGDIRWQGTIVHLPVSNRKTISGLGVPEGQVPIVAFCLESIRRMSHASLTIPDLESAAQSAHGQLQTRLDQIESELSAVSR